MCRKFLYTIQHGESEVAFFEKWRAESRVAVFSKFKVREIDSLDSESRESRRCFLKSHLFFKKSQSPEFFRAESRVAIFENFSWSHSLELTT